MQTVRIRAVKGAKEYEVSAAHWQDMIQTGRARRFTVVPEKKIQGRDRTPKDEPPAELEQFTDTFE